MIGGGQPFVPEIIDLNWPVRAKNVDFKSIFACSASAITPSEKVQLTRIESPLRAF